MRCRRRRGLIRLLIGLLVLRLRRRMLARPGARMGRHWRCRRRRRLERLLHRPRLWHRRRLRRLRL